MGRLFRNIHPSLQYSSHSCIHTSLYDFFPQDSNFLDIYQDSSFLILLLLGVCFFKGGGWSGRWSCDRIREREAVVCHLNANNIKTEIMSTDRSSSPNVHNTLSTVSFFVQAAW